MQVGRGQPGTGHEGVKIVGPDRAGLAHATGRAGLAHATGRAVKIRPVQNYIRDFVN